MEIIAIIAALVAVAISFASFWVSKQAFQLAKKKDNDEQIVKKSASIKAEHRRTKGRLYSDLIISNIGMSDAKNVRVVSVTEGIALSFQDVENPYSLLSSGDSYTIQMFNRTESNNAPLMLMWDDENKTGNKREQNLYIGLR